MRIGIGVGVPLYAPAPYYYPNYYPYGYPDYYPYPYRVYAPQPVYVAPAYVQPAPQYYYPVPARPRQRLPILLTTRLLPPRRRRRHIRRHPISSRLHAGIAAADLAPVQRPFLPDCLPSRNRERRLDLEVAATWVDQSPDTAFAPLRDMPKSSSTRRLTPPACLPLPTFSPFRLPPSPLLPRGLCLPQSSRGIILTGVSLLRPPQRPAPEQPAGE